MADFKFIPHTIKKSYFFKKKFVLILIWTIGFIFLMVKINKCKEIMKKNKYENEYFRKELIKAGESINLLKNQVFNIKKNFDIIKEMENDFYEKINEL